MKWNGNISKVNPQPGETIFIEGCTPEMFRMANDIRSMFPDNNVFLLSPAQSFHSLSDKELAHFGLQRIKRKAQVDFECRCEFEGCDHEPFRSIKARDHHFRLVHTEEGRAQVARMQKARKIKK